MTYETWIVVLSVLGLLSFGVSCLMGRLIAFSEESTPRPETQEEEQQR